MKIIKPKHIGLSSNGLQKIDDLILSYVETNKIAGAISLVYRYDELAHFKCYGKQDLENNKPMQQDTIFRMYSMTKPITSLAMMMLYEQGQFELNTPVYEFIPNFKYLEVFDSGTIHEFKTVKTQKAMTIKDLLCHTSGLTYDFMNSSPVDALYRQAGIQGSHANGTLKDLVNKLSKMPLLFSPGTKWNYSLSSEVIAYLIEVISGKSFNAFIKENITQPLEMVDTDFYVPENKQNRFSANYTHIDLIPTEQKKQFSQYMTTEYNSENENKLILIDDPKKGRFSQPRTFYSGGGGLVSTAGDYLNFTKMLLQKGWYKGNQIISPKTVELMTTNHLPTDLANFSIPGFSETSPVGIGFGLGFAVTLDPLKSNTLGSAGEFSWGGGANTLFFIDPPKALIGILLMQLLPSTAYPIRNEFKIDFT